MGVGGPYRDADLRRSIDGYCRAEGLNTPDQFLVPAIMEYAVGRFLSSLGASSVVIHDDFRENHAELSVAVFDEGQSWWKPKVPIKFDHGALHLPEPGVLMTSDFDECYMHIAMTDRALAAARPDLYFEGTYADATTYPDWLNPVDFLTRGS